MQTVAHPRSTMGCLVHGFAARRVGPCENAVIPRPLYQIWGAAYYNRRRWRFSIHQLMRACPGGVRAMVRRHISRAICRPQTARRDFVMGKDSVTADEGYVPDSLPVFTADLTRWRVRGQDANRRGGGRGDSANSSDPWE